MHSVEVGDKWATHLFHCQRTTRDRACDVPSVGQVRYAVLMGFRFWRRLKIAPGVTLNLSKSGGSLSFGPRGAKYTIGPRGQRVTGGIPGTGLFYTKRISSGRGGRRTNKSRAQSRSRTKDRLTLGFLERLTTPKNERAFVEGLREYVTGDLDGAMHKFGEAEGIADAAFLAGGLALERGEYDAALSHLRDALRRKNLLGQLFDKYQVDIGLDIDITDEVGAHIGTDERGVLLAIVEIHQEHNEPREAIKLLERLIRMDPDDPVIRLSLAELLLETRGSDRRICHKVVTLIGEVSNESPVHGGLMLYKAMALRRMNMLTPARNLLTTLLRKRKDRPKELLKAARYERMLVYEALGRPKRALSDLEALYAEDPRYEDVASRLGLDE